MGTRDVLLEDGGGGVRDEGGRGVALKRGERRCASGRAARTAAAAIKAVNRYDFTAELLKAGRRPTQVGFVPYRMLELFQTMRIEFRLWRAEKDGRKRRWIEERILNDAGILGHYVSDTANPHHTTIHYNGWSGDNPKGYAVFTNAPNMGIHYRFEEQYVQSHIKLNDMLPLIAGEARVIEKPREEIDLVEVHDCFSVTELVTMEDLFISPEGGAIKDVLDGFYDADGTVPCQIDGGLKCFGHPIGASGMRMIYELYLQMQGKAGPRQRKELPRYGLTHNLGGFPHQNVCSISVIGRYGE